MKSVSLFVSTFVISTIFFACSGKQNANEQSALESKKQEISETKAANTSTAILNSYIKLKDALIASDAGQAQQTAVALLEDIDAIKMPELEQNAKEIAATENLDTQRTYFDSLSIHVYEMAKTTEADMPTLYKQYCPMAFNNQGAFWLSFQEEIRNPYFGDQMLKCGRVEETLQ